MRVVYVVSTLRRAGPTSQLLNIVRHLDRSRFEPVIVTLSPEPPDSMARAFGALPVAVKSLSMSRAQAMLHRDWRRDIENLLGASLDGRVVVHSQGIRADVMSSKHLAGVPRVATARNYPHDDYPMKFGPLLGRWMAWSHLRAFRALPRVVACSSTLSAMLLSHGVSSEVICNGVDTDRFNAPRPEEKARLRDELGLDRSARAGVSVGALSERKDPLRIVRAMRSVDDSALRLTMVGSGSLEAACRREAEGDGRIRFAGEVEDVLPFLRSADFFVSAAKSEGLPNAALEGIACGLHAILSDIGPHREIIGSCPGAGELVAVEDTPALAGAMRRAASGAGPRAMPPAAEVAGLFGARRMSERYQALYLTVLEEARRVIQPA